MYVCMFELWNYALAYFVATINQKLRKAENPASVFSNLIKNVVNLKKTWKQEAHGS